MDHHELYEEAKRLTRVHAKLAHGIDLDLDPGGKPKPLAPALAAAETIHVLPGQVFILMLNDLILGVLAVEQKAIDEAYSLMRARGDGLSGWSAVQENRRWECRCYNGFHTVSISVHDVR